MHRAHPAQRFLDPLLVVVAQEGVEAGDELLCLDAVPVAVVEKHIFHASKQALAGGVVGAAPLPRHRPGDAVLLADVDPALPAMVARLDRHLRRARHRALDVEEGVLTRQFKGGGLLRQAGGGVLLRKGLGRCWHAGIHGDAGRLSGLVPRQAPQERSGLYEPMQYRRELGLAAWEKPVRDFHRTPLSAAGFRH